MKIDCVLPSYVPAPSQGCYVHFSQLARALRMAGCEVVFHASTAEWCVPTSKGLAWPETLAAGPQTGPDGMVFRHRLRDRKLGGAVERLRTMAGLAREYWHNGEPRAHQGIGEGIPDTEAQALELLARIRKTVAKAHPLHHQFQLDKLGPMLPADEIAKAAQRRGAVLMAGFFPFRLCHDLALSARRRGVPFFITPFFHPLDVNHHNALLLESCRIADGVFCLSPWTTEFFKRELGAERAVHLGSAAPALASEPASSSSSSASLEAHPSGPPYFLFIGRNELGKNLPEALEIVDALRWREKTDFRLRILSRLSSDEVAMLPPFAEVIAPCSSEELAAHCRGAQAMLFPSVLESFGIVIMEALRVGTPVLVKESNLASASVLRQLGLGQLVYGSIEEALAQAAAPERAAVVRADLSFYTWPRVAERCIAALRGQSLPIH